MNRIKKIVSILPDEVVYDTMQSPVGLLLIAATDQGVHAILWEHEANSDVCKVALESCQHHGNHTIILRTKNQLEDYFSSKRKTFDIPLCLQGTHFQRQAWQALSQIPYGQTISYSEQALKLGNKNKARAVGLANGLNPISIVVPCHRVIGKSGDLTGFAGKLDCKAFLLNLEKNSSLAF